MAWAAITTDDVKRRLAGAEVTALQTAALASGQSDPLPETIIEVVDEVRGYIAAAGYSLEAGNTVPSRLRSAALAMIRYRLATRLPVKAFLTTDRVEENAAALRLMAQVSAGRFSVEDPATADTETSGSAASPSFERPTLDFTRDAQDGA
jgi:hypothetical protein